MDSSDPSRERLDDARPGVTQRFCVHLENGKELKFFAVVNVDSNSKPKELFIRTNDRESPNIDTCPETGKVPEAAIGGIDLSQLEAMAIALSIALQWGVPLGDITTKWIGMHGSQRGRVRVPWNKDGYYNAKSLPDLLGTWLEWKFLGRTVEDTPQNSGLPIASTSDHSSES